MNDVDHCAKIIWEYMLLHQELKPADVIFVLGSNDTRVAKRAAELYLQQLAPTIIFSGGNGRGSDFDRPEAEVFADVATSCGVPEDAIIKEPHSSNTGENILFTKKLLEEKDIHPSSVILVQKPYMERRAYAACCKQWPEVTCVITSPQVSYEEYTPDDASRARVCNAMVGDLHRIKEYPALGFQTEQDIPDKVWKAWEKLVALGYSKYVLPV